MSHMVDVVDNEAARLNALRDLRLLDTPPSEAFDRLTRLASQLLSAPVSTISLTDADRQWFKSRVGVDLAEIPREQAPCSYAIQGQGVFVVPDLLEDPRFATSPLAQAGIRFYAGAPLFTRAGHGLGVICVVDDTPRTLAETEERVLQDLASMVMSQVELQNMIGRVDPTTGAANQHQMFEDLDDLARTAPREPVRAVLVDLLSPERATDLSRTLGTSGVEAVMRQALSIIERGAGNSARAYHVGPLRCALLLDGADTGSGDWAVERVARALDAPILSDHVPVALDPVFGIYDLVPADVPPRDVLRRLVIALAQARTDGTSRARFDPLQEERSARRFRLLNDFAAALAAPDQLSLVFQPRYELLSGRRRGVEALLRWTHPSLGPVSPGEFVPLIEQTALARPLMDWVAHAALAQLRDWTAAGVDLCMSINASALNLDEADFAERLLATTTDLGVDPALVELEFTESAVARDGARVIEQMSRLRASGMRIAIDDFGTGYSNLAYLQQLPVSVLKIDQAFVRDLATSATDQTLVRAMIAMAHDLGYEVVAEGIETAEAYDLLRAWGCDEGQGYHMSRPVPPAVIAATANTSGLARSA
jgi:EAL domain-containing protein (putative c-di-GMP-specific phosphodiesterase class I)/GGDEF domain-containing protein